MYLCLDRLLADSSTVLENKLFNSILVAKHISESFIIQARYYLVY